MGAFCGSTPGVWIDFRRKNVLKTTHIALAKADYYGSSSSVDRVMQL
jgi:hypothetical protein